MAERHFFEEAPTLSWFTWISRNIYSNTITPNTLPSNLINRAIPRAKSGTYPRLAKAENAKEYSHFLANYFYNPETNIQLDVPPLYIKNAIESKYITGVEIRDTAGKLIGCVFDFYSGKWNNKSTGIVSWMCVLPTWRNKGIGSCLLFALYYYTLPREIHFWRNDGWMRSPIPPLYNEARIQRKKQVKRTSIQRSTIQLRKVPFAKWKLQFINQWNYKHPHGIVLDDDTINQRQVWETTNSTVALFIQPTFEKRIDTRETYCEIIAWTALPKSEYEQAQLIETVIDYLPFDYIEAPEEMPHFDQNWQKTSKVCWSCIGLDPGYPVMKPILSLCGVF
jgi:hypothetical protein